MKQFKGTKGEWKTLEKNRVVYVENKDKVLIAEIDYCKTLGFEQATPRVSYFNAKLIAAAPELLKALQELVHLHQCEQEGLSSGQPTPKQWYETVLKAEEAINKAL